jgi:sec-independent protein translocase protein TatA
MTSSLVAIPGGWELIVIVLLIVLLFGARKLPELARGTGQALRIFKSETKGLRDDDDTAGETEAPTKAPTQDTTQRQLEAGSTEPTDIVRERRDDTA